MNLRLPLRHPLRKSLRCTLTSRTDALLDPKFGRSLHLIRVSLIQLYNSGDVAAPIRFAFSRRLDGRLLGTVGFHTISPAHRTAERAFDFHPGCWGKGLALLCAQATIKWGFDTQDFVRIQAIVLDSNQRSRRVIEKCGMHFEGRCRNYRMVRGEPRTCDLFAICPN